MIHKNINSLQKLFSSHVLLYHSTFSVVPNEIKEGLHNIHPEVLFNQITWYKKYFDIMKVDDLFESADKRGKMSITFDDGYLSVINEAIPILKELNVPSTIFLNGCSMNGKIFWRDKIRYIINKDLVSDFLNYFKNESKIRHLTKLNFYKQTKSPNINSKYIEGLCDLYLKKRFGKIKINNYCLNSADQIVNDDLVSYGSHSYSHYVLSSLSSAEQEDEIIKNYEILKNFQNKSHIFSIPFGGPIHFNNQTLKIVKKYGYKGVLYSQDKININSKNETLIGLDRFMAPNSFSALHKFLPKVLFKTIFR